VLPSTGPLRYSEHVAREGRSTYDTARRLGLEGIVAKRVVHYVVANDVASLVYLANLGTVPIHAWHSRTGNLEHPDWCFLDLDPKDAPFAAVVEVALAIRDLCGEIDLPALPKTSGASGLHVLVLLGGRLTHDQARTLGELLAGVIVRRLRELATVTRAVGPRQGKVYVDYLQNGHRPTDA